MKRNIWIAVILVAVVIGGIAFWSLQNPSTLKQIVPVQGNETVREYDSRTYGFSFAYPKDWVVVENSNIYRGPDAVEFIALQDSKDNFDANHRLLVEVTPKSNLQYFGIERCTIVRFNAVTNVWIEVKDAEFGKETDTSSGVCPDLVHSERTATPNAEVGNTPAYFNSSSLTYLVPLSGEYALQILLIDLTDDRRDQKGNLIIAESFRTILDSFEIR
jgi:hypothetical protein